MKIAQRKFWNIIFLKGQQKSEEFKNQEWPHRKLQEAFYSCHPVPPLGASGHRSEELYSTWKGRAGEPYWPHHCGRLQSSLRSLPQSSAKLILSDCATWSPSAPFLPRVGAVPKARPAFRDPHHCRVLLSGIRIAQHLAIHRTRAATALQPTPAPGHGFVPLLGKPALP